MKQTRLTNTTVSLGDNRTDRVTHGLWYIHQLQRWRRGRRGSHLCSRLLQAPRHTHTHAGDRTCAHAPHHGPAPPRPRTPFSIHTHRHPAQRAKGGGLSPVRVLLYVIIGGGTIKEARVEGFPLLPSGEDSGDGAESHLLFLLFPFLVFKIL